MLGRLSRLLSSVTASLPSRTRITIYAPPITAIVASETTHAKGSITARRIIDGPVSEVNGDHSPCGLDHLCLVPTAQTFHQVPTMTKKGSERGDAEAHLSLSAAPPSWPGSKGRGLAGIAIGMTALIRAGVLPLLLKLPEYTRARI